MTRKALLQAFLVLLVVVISVLLFINRSFISHFEAIGYPGAFLIGLVSNATFILPMPGLLILFTLATVFNPVLIGLLGAAGGAVGELSGYALGYSGRAITGDSKWVNRGEELIQKRGFLAIFLFALVPFLPFDVLGLVAGILRYPVWKFILASFLGKALLYVAVALASAQGWNVVQRIFG